MQRRFLIGLLLTVTVLVDLVALVIVSGRTWPELGFAVLLSLTFSQVSLTAIWAALGSTSLPWRMAGGIVVVTCWTMALAQGVDGKSLTWQSEGWIDILLSQAILLGSLVLAAHLAGLRLVDTSAGESVKNAPALQFSLGDMFVWITAVSIALGMIASTVDFELWFKWRPDWRDIVPVLLGNALLAVVCLWLMLGTDRLIVRGITGCVATSGVLFVHSRIASPPAFVALALLTFLQVALLTASLLVFRQVGYRVGWRRIGRTRD